MNTNFVRLRYWKVLLLLAVVPFAACASGSGSGSGSTTSSRDVISFEEVQNTTAGSAYEIVQRLRPRWLQRRGTSVAAVRIDGRIMTGGLVELQNIRGIDVEEIRFINSRDATTQFGTGFPGGVIDVSLRR